MRTRLLLGGAVIVLKFQVPAKRHFHSAKLDFVVTWKGAA